MSKSLYSKLATELHVMTESFGHDETLQTKKEAQQRFADMIAMESSLLSEGDDDSDSATVIQKLHDGEFDTSPVAFHTAYQSMLSGKNSSALSMYSLDDFKSMHTYKVAGYDVGFAIKNGDEIVSVFNASPAKSIGDELIRAATRNGGKRLDHYDGFLTGFYRRNGFKIETVVQWSDEFTPTGWPFPKLNIDDPKQSVYANEYLGRPKRGTSSWKKKGKQYLAGKPDVIYRTI